MNLLSLEGKGFVVLLNPPPKYCQVNNCFPIICLDYQYQQNFLQGGARYVYIK